MILANYSKEEYWDLFHEDRLPTNITSKRGAKIPDGLYHLVVHSWIMDFNGNFLISQRQEGRPYELLWERTGGSALAGETSLEAARREVKEELGIDLCETRAYFIKSVKREKYHDFFDAWLFIVHPESLSYNADPSEVKAYRWVSLNELEELAMGNKTVKSSNYYGEVYQKYIEILGRD